MRTPDDPTLSAEKRWRVGLTLEGLSRDQVPVGSCVRVTAPLREAVVGRGR
jgi:hypothetical protein